MKYLFKIVLFLLFSILLIGCQTEPIPLKVDESIRIDKTLLNKIIVVDSINRVRNDNFLEVQFTLQNRLSHSNVDALYQIQWFDKDGFKIKSITDTFMRIHLAPDEEKTYSIIASSQKVLTYKIAIVDYDSSKKRVPNENIKNDN